MSNINKPVMYLRNSYQTNSSIYYETITLKETDLQQLEQKTKNSFWKGSMTMMIKTCAKTSELRRKAMSGSKENGQEVKRSGMFKNTSRR